MVTFEILRFYDTNDFLISSMQHGQNLNRDHGMIRTLFGYKSILSALFHQITLLDIQNLENRVILQFELFLSCLSSNVFFKICVMRIKIKYFYVLRINF